MDKTRRGYFIDNKIVKTGLNEFLKKSLPVSSTG